MQSDHEPDEQRAKEARQVRHLRMSSLEFGEVCRAAGIAGTRPATFMREYLVTAAREILQREREDYERR